MVDCMVALPGQLFYSTQIPACLWFLAPQQEPRAAICATGAARSCSSMPASSARWWTARARSFRTTTSPRSPAPITHGVARRGRDYADMPGFCKAASCDEIKGHDHVLTPGRYVGAADIEDDDVPFVERFAALRMKLEEQFSDAEKVTATIRSETGWDQP